MEEVVALKPVVDSNILVLNIDDVAIFLISLLFT